MGRVDLEYAEPRARRRRVRGTASGYFRWCCSTSTRVCGASTAASPRRRCARTSPRAWRRRSTPKRGVALLRRWLLVPRAPRVADAARAACAELATGIGAALPRVPAAPRRQAHVDDQRARRQRTGGAGSLRLTLRALLDMLDAPTLQPLNTARLGVVREEARDRGWSTTSPPRARRPRPHRRPPRRAARRRLRRCCRPRRRRAAADARRRRRRDRRDRRPSVERRSPSCRGFARNARRSAEGMIHPADSPPPRRARRRGGGRSRGGGAPAAGEYELVHARSGRPRFKRDAKGAPARGKGEAGGGGRGDRGGGARAAASSGGGDGGVRGSAVDRPEALPNRHHGARARRDGGASHWRGVRRRDGGGAARAAGTLQ